MGMGISINNITITAVTITMAQSRVPMTLRDFFFDDPFFKSTWDDFEVVRENMFKESREMWKRFEENFGSLETSSSRSLLQSSAGENKEMSSTNVLQSSAMEKDLKEEMRVAKKKDNDERFGWMMPSMFDNDFFKQLEMFDSKDKEVIRVKDDKEKFEVSLDTSQYRPDELRVNVGEGIISVEGKHEEKSEDGRTMVLRQFSRKYSLPESTKPESVVSNLSQDGVLVVSAPKAPSIENSKNRNVPIESK